MGTELSYSSMKTLTSCEQEYWHYRVAKTPVDSDYEESDALGVGKALHQTLEKTKHKKFIPELLLEAMDEFKVPVEDFALLSAMCRKYVKLHQLSGLEVVGVEFGIHVDGLYRGYIDMIMVDPRGWWWIGDLKTTSRFDQSLLPRLPRDMQLNLYSYFRDAVARQFGLDPEKFKGCRYRAITKSKSQQKKFETEEQYIARLEEYVEVYDIEVPFDLMNPDEAWELLTEAHVRSKQLHEGEAPRKNYGACISYFKPCRYFSQCHGDLFSKSKGKVKIHTVESFQESDIL